MNSTLLSAHDLTKSYVIGTSRLRVLRGCSLHVAETEFVAISGASGSGKSTLLHILGALDTPDAGRVTFRGEDIFASSKARRREYTNRQVGFVFQFYHLLPELTALENVMLPRLVTHGAMAWRTERRDARRDSEKLLERVGLQDRAKHRPKELSGGERQRVAIARALINRPALLLADEPTGNLDESIGRDILALLMEFSEAGQTIVMVTHDPKVASRAHRRIVLTAGALREKPVENSSAASGMPAESKEAAP